MYKTFFILFLLSSIVAAQNPTRNVTGLVEIGAAALTQPFISMDPDDIRFYIFPSRKNPCRMREIVYNNVRSLKRAGIVRNTEIRIYIHGFIANITTGGCNLIKTAYLKKGYDNIICVDWGKLSKPNTNIIPEGLLQFASYPEVVYKSTKIVGKRLAEFLIFLKKQKVVKTYASFHLIGHSLGAHISGTAGYHIKRQTKNAIGWITGLDPAGPLYEMSLVPPKFKLTRKKAVFVEALHTDAGAYGTTETAGHVDYFANGGRGIDQPQCGLVDDIISLCGHFLAVDYMERSLLGEKLIGCRCRFNKKAPLKSPCPKPRRCRRIARVGTVLKKRFFGNYYVGVRMDPPPDIAKDYITYTEGAEVCVNSTRLN